MRVFESPGTLKRFRRTRWEFQRTFHTALEDLPRLVDVILSGLPGITGSVATLDQVVFEPRYGLASLCTKYSLPHQWDRDDLTIEAEGPAEVRELLEAVLSEWVDFLFVPAPGPFVVYADHDEYLTLLAHRKGQLAAVVGALNAAAFRAVDYVRRLS